MPVALSHTYIAKTIMVMVITLITMFQKLSWLFSYKKK